MKKKDIPQTLEAFEREVDRASVFVITHNHTIWKGLFFKSKEQATMVLKRFHPKLEFELMGDYLREKKHGKTFRVYELKEYLKMDDIAFVYDLTINR